MDFPKVKDFLVKIDGLEKEVQFLFTIFQNKIFLIVSQIGKIGALVQGSVDQRTDDPVFGALKKQMFSVEMVLGDRSNELLLVLVRQMMQHLPAKHSTKDLLVSFSLEAIVQNDEDVLRQYIHPIIAEYKTLVCQI
eukprot:snap_masked-scaffold_5-processed-gene-11.13-mRNA-1 protein AED:1.00 eAED:1.00 QI:0/-1/0/0/-1/1/1/0/135